MSTHWTVDFWRRLPDGAWTWHDRAIHAGSDIDPNAIMAEYLEDERDTADVHEDWYCACTAVVTLQSDVVTIGDGASPQ